MKTLKIMLLVLGVIQPITTRANPVSRISDFDYEFKGVERITFECPIDYVGKIKSPNIELDDQPTSERSWVDFYPTYLNVMNK